MASNPIKRPQISSNSKILTHGIVKIKFLGYFTNESPYLKNSFATGFKGENSRFPRMVRIKYVYLNVVPTVATNWYSEAVTSWLPV